MKISSQINVATQRNVKENKNIAKTTNLTKVNGSFVDLLNFKAQINKVNIQPNSNLPFTGTCLIDKKAWDSMSTREKNSIYEDIGLTSLAKLFGYNFDYRQASTREMLYHPDFDRFKKRLELAQHFSGYTSRYVPDLSWGTGTRYYSDNIREVQFCFLENNSKYEEEAAQIDIALFLIKNKKPMENLKIIIFDSKKHMEEIGFSIIELNEALKQWQKGESLSEEQLDKLADLKIYLNLSKKDELFDEALSLKLEERVQKESFVNYPDGTKSEIIKTKYATYYRIKNGTNHNFVCNDPYKNPYENYYINFPKGTWKETRKLKHPWWSDKSLSISTVEGTSEYEKYPITLPRNGKNCFIKIKD